jgi:hypothetical protein
MARADPRQMQVVPVMIPVVPFGISLSIFLAISYALCILFYLLFPESAQNHAVLSLFLPWVKVLTWSGFLLGLVASVACGWYVALVFGPLYNFFASRRW